MLQNLIQRTVRNLKSHSPILSAAAARRLANAAYEGEGKTTVRVINMEQDLGLMIDSYGLYGFKLNNGVTVLGPMAIFPRSVLSWQVGGADDITEGSLRLFRLLEPRVDLVVMGLDTESRAVHDRVLQLARNVGLNVEILPTEHACSTFNFLNAEGRFVVGAMIPPAHIAQYSPDDMLRSKLHYNDLYNAELK